MQVCIVKPLQAIDYKVYAVPVNAKTGHGAIRVMWLGNSSLLAARKCWKGPVNLIRGFKTTQPAGSGLYGEKEQVLIHEGTFPDGGG